MQTPALLPQELLYTQEAASDEALFALLLKKPFDMMHYFAAAADDETWSGDHADFMGKVLDWITDMVLGERLPFDYYQLAYLACQKHSQALKTMIPKNIVIKLSDKEVPFNSFLLASSSGYFKDLIRKEIVEAQSKVLAFPHLPYEVFAPIEEFIHTGSVPGLKTMSQESLYTLISRLSAWNLDALSVMAEENLKKYLTPENCIALLKKAIQERWPHFAKRCAEYINQREWGVRVDVPTVDRLEFEFYHFGESAMERFSLLKNSITDLVCSGKLTDSPEFAVVVRSCPQMQMLDISASDDFTDMLYEIPKELKALNVSECIWLTKETLKKFYKICPELETLLLVSNVQLNYASWAEVTKFQNLKSLNLSLCHQLQDEELSLLLKGLRDLRGLSLSRCDRIYEKGFLELAKIMNRLETLDLTNTNISDTALVEICSRCALLGTLNVSYCQNLTEKGILASVKLSRNLREINLSRCNISQDALAEIARTRSTLWVIL